jgi:hypothetical protein
MSYIHEFCVRTPEQTTARQALMFLPDWMYSTRSTRGTSKSWATCQDSVVRAVTRILSGGGDNTGMQIFSGQVSWKAIT